MNRQDQAEINSMAIEWRTPALVFVFSLLILLAAYYETAESMVSIWWRSETFAHGFLIVPITLYLVWDKLPQLKRVAPVPTLVPVVLAAINGLGWLVANIVDVQVVQQFALVAMIPLLVWALLGWQVVWLLIFPLAFLFFAVPVGEFLVPPLMNFTADFTVKMVELVGIPVYREGLFFSLPSGDWNVVEGCSGLRYLIASITLGTLYAYLTYRSLSRRILFVVMAIIFPIIANGLRAFMIVMIAHYSDMKLALGVDHYIYGWAFFGVVMFLMFWIGSFWREDSNNDAMAKENTVLTAPLETKKMATVALLLLVVSSVWPIRAALVESQIEIESKAVEINIPSNMAGWQISNQQITDWRPEYQGQKLELNLTYQNGKESTVGLFIRYYRDQQQGQELINSQNILVRQKDPRWKMLDQMNKEVMVSGENLLLKRSRVSSNDDRYRYLVWHWNWVSDSHTASELKGKLLEAKDKLLGSPLDSAGIILLAEYSESPEEAEKQLQLFADAIFKTLDSHLKQAAGL